MKKIEKFIDFSDNLFFLWIINISLIICCIKKMYDILVFVISEKVDFLI